LLYPGFDHIGTGGVLSLSHIKSIAEWRNYTILIATTQVLKNNMDYARTDEFGMTIFCEID